MLCFCNIHLYRDVFCVIVYIYSFHSMFPSFCVCHQLPNGCAISTCARVTSTSTKSLRQFFSRQFFSAPQIDGYDWFGPILANNQNHFVSVFSAFGPNTFPGLFAGFFKPSADVQKVLDEYHSALFSKFYVIGVQLRVAGVRLSRKAEESVWRTMLYLKTEAEASQAKPVVFYVCADSKEPWDRVVSLFGQENIFSASVAAGRIGRVSKEVPLARACCVCFC
jgi:hypothetical protein